MRKFILALIFTLGAFMGMFQTAQASTTAASIFTGLGGTATFDSGGAVHSQARSIYSLGGGQVSFSGKRVSLLSADAPSFDAGCAGISWHFGGFAFISMDEIRQLVQSIAQASLGVAIDLAMQVLCPQCYAVMTKLRDIANAIRAAAADSCKIAQALARDVADAFGVTIPEKRQTDCSVSKAKDGTTQGFVESIAGSLCNGLSGVNKALTEAGGKYQDWLNRKPGAETPDRQVQVEYGNRTYKALRSLGYNEGFIMDVLLSTLGMQIKLQGVGADCSVPFRNFKGATVGTSTPETVAQDPIIQSLVAEKSPKEVPAKADGSLSATDAQLTKANGVAKTSATEGDIVCTAPPLITGLDSVGKMLLCGPDPAADARTFAANVQIPLDKVAAGPMGALCGVKGEKAGDVAFNSLGSFNPMLYSCPSNQEGCHMPTMVRAHELISKYAKTGSSEKGYHGLAWMVTDALFMGARAVTMNTPMPTRTKEIVNAIDYPIYRILNLAAIYPHLSHDILTAYAAQISVHYVVDTLDVLAPVGAQPTIDMKLSEGVAVADLDMVRRQLMTANQGSKAMRETILSRLAEKRSLVDLILEVNKSLQADVLSRGLLGNSQLAISLKESANARSTGSQSNN